jgi:AAA domain, putative AbiEii toxin, Type IV TA system
MVLRLELASPHRSIRDLINAPELAPFSVLTGINGSGKSHLLAAIANGSITAWIDGTQVALGDIRMFTWQDILATAPQTADISLRLTAARARWEIIVANRRSTAGALRHEWTTAGLDHGGISDFKLFERSREYLSEYEGIRAVIASSSAVITSQLNAFATKEQPWHDRIDASALVDEHGTLFGSISEPEFRQLLVGRFTSLDPFKHELSSIFALYRRLERENYANQMDPSPTSPPLGDDEFLEQYGPRPWDRVNELLDRGGYRFRFSTPETDGPYDITVVSTEGDDSWTFADLSSGERVLVAFTLASYSVRHGRLSSHRPKLVLLDEIDAPLHPSMIKSVIDTLSEVIVQEYGAACLMTTHNPATVAMSQNAVVYLVSPTVPRIRIATVQEAVASLSDGVSGLSVSVELRRVVWVESNLDVVRYERLLSALRRELVGTFEPSFHSVGFATVNGERQSDGKARVKEVVGSLRKSGVTNVNGLVDRDNDSADSDDVKFVGGVERYSIENFLLDPLLVALLAIRERFTGKLSRDALGISLNGTYGDLDLTDAAAIQIIVNQVLVLAGVAVEDSAQVCLHGGTTIILPMSFLNVRGHDWYTALIEAVPEFKRFRSEHELMLTIIDKVIADNPGVVSAALTSSFGNLVGLPQHGVKRR